MMNISEKKQHIQSLSEDDLRQKVIMPLLSKLGFVDPIHNHGPNEKGKDIVCTEIDPIFKKDRYLAIIVKKGNITGSSSSSDSFFTVTNQIKQALNEPYKHPYIVKEISIDECILVASGKISPTAIDSILGTLRQERIDKAIRQVIDIDKLISLIDEKYNEFWAEVIDEKSALINQRNFLLNNISKLVKIIMPKHEDQEKTLKLISKSEIDFDLLPYNTANRYIANIGYNKIDIDEIDEYFTDDIDNFYCDIKNYVFDLKKNAQNVLYDIDEVVDILKNILKEKNPSKIIEHCWHLRSCIGWGGNIVYNARDLDSQDDFYTAIEEYKYKKEILLKNSVFPLYTLINKDIKSKCKNGLIQFWEKHPKDEKNAWLGYRVNFVFNENKIISSEVYEFLRDVKKTVDEHHGSLEIELLNSNGKDSISIELAVNYYGIPHENKLSIESAAEEFIWHFRKPITEKFVEILSANS